MEPAPHNSSRRNQTDPDLIAGLKGPRSPKGCPTRPVQVFIAFGGRMPMLDSPKGCPGQPEGLPYEIVARYNSRLTAQEDNRLATVIVRPSTKLLKLSYLLAAGLAFGIAIYNSRRDEALAWLYIVPALLFIWTAVKHFGRRFQTMTIAGNRLRYESGMLSRSARTLELSRVQDVVVEQSFTQRLLGVGEISIETAGERSRLVMKGIDRPRQVADLILDTAHQGSGEQWSKES